MYTENGLLVDLGEIETIIHNGDVIAASFHLFPERLLIDTRFDPNDTTGRCETPMVAIVDPVDSVQDRIFWLGQHRPALGVPKAFSYFHWPHSVRYLAESGVWQRVRDRIVSSGFTGAGETCDDALRDLTERERGATADAIRGSSFQAVWSADGG